MQDAPSIAAGDARLQALSGTGTKVVVVLGISLTLFLTTLVVATGFILTSEDGLRTIDSDFRVFWATARLVLAGDPLAALDQANLEAQYNTVTEDWMPWLYPPGYMFVITPFGAMSYAWAFLVATLIAIMGMALASRPFVAGVKPIWAAMALAPSYLPALVIGQNSMIWLAVLMAALAAMRSGKAVLAGVLIGCLTLKPQLGVLIPFALLAAGQWRTILAALGTTLVLAIVPTLIVGPEYWPLLSKNMSEHASRMIELVNELFLTVGPFAFLAQLGLPPATGLSLQWGVMAVAALSVFVFWRSDRISFDAKVGLLMTAILLSAPYLWYYEAAMMAAIGLFLVRAGILTTRWPHLVLVALLWIGAGLQSMDLVFPLFEDRYLGAFIVTPVLTACFVLCWAHLLQARRAQAA